MAEVILSAILALYAVFILQLAAGFGKVKDFIRTEAVPKTAFSIIVPFRNEAKNLPKLLESIARLNYPRELFELILVDDFSKDTSERICINWRIRNDDIDTTLLENLRLTHSPKKDAIARAVPIIKHPWIITTDADCTVNPDWLLTLDGFIRQNTNIEMVAGAVAYKTKNNWFHHFQQLDMMGLQATTIGSFGIGKPFMCNGANFAYTKKLFDELGGFGGIGQVSGDDVMLLQKAVQHDRAKVGYLKNKAAIVKTRPENDLFKLFMQRVRWAGKTTGYRSGYAKMLAVAVLLANLAMVGGCCLMIAGKLNWKIFAAAFLLKYGIDYALLYRANAYLRNGRFLLPLASSVIYPVFCSLAGVYSLFFGFRWKGRSFKR